MNTAKVLQRLRVITTDGVELRRVARDVAHELIRGRLSILREFVAGIARLPVGGFADFALGYREALADVAATFTAALELHHEQDAAETIPLSYRPYLFALADGAAAPGELARRLHIDPAQVSRVLGVLRQGGLAAFWTVEGQDRRTRPHHLTLRGQRLVAKLRESAETELPTPIAVARTLSARSPAGNVAGVIDLAGRKHKGRLRARQAVGMTM